VDTSLAVSNPRAYLLREARGMAEGRLRKLRVLTALEPA
jgi:hypothetical protein